MFDGTITYILLGIAEALSVANQIEAAQNQPGVVSTAEALGESRADSVPPARVNPVDVDDALAKVLLVLGPACGGVILAMSLRKRKEGDRRE